MSDTTAHTPGQFGFLSAQLPVSQTADNKYTEAALAEHKRDGLELAVKSRWIAMGIIALFLVFLNPDVDVLFYHAILLLLCFNGWLMRRIGRVGQSRPELLLIFLDLAIMTAGMVIPNPFSEHDLPVAMQYRFDNFLYFFVILAAGTLAYSWRTVIAIGTWTAGIWTFGLVTAWLYSEPVAGLSEAAFQAFGHNELLIEFLDPNSFVFRQRIQEVLVFVLVAIIMGLSMRRSNVLLMNNAGLERERANLSRYFSPNVVDELSQNDEPLKQIRSQNVGVLFIDIVGFTRLADALDPRDVIELLRGFHARMEQEVFRHHGTLDKYLGDGLMATFGTPVAGDRDATNTLACALAMTETLELWNAERRRQGNPELKAGIGIHYGEAVLGDIGANRLEFAVIGTPVNVAARLEALTRDYGARIVISDRLLQQAQAENGRALPVSNDLRKRSRQEIRGIANPMDIWTLD
jgi:adenylate cyclase